MLQRKPQYRLGYNGIHEIKEHPWLKDFDFNALNEKRIESPFIPKLGDNFDKKYCESSDKLGNETLDRYQKYYAHEEFQNIFNNYTFISNIPEEVTKSVNKKNTTSFIKTSSKIKFDGNSHSTTPIRQIKSLSCNNTSYANFMKDKTPLFKINPNNIKIKAKPVLVGRLDISKSITSKVKEVKIDKLPSIELRSPGHIKKLSYSPSVNMFGKITKNMTSSNNSTGASTTSLNAFHKRSGSTNNFNY